MVTLSGFEFAAALIAFVDVTRQRALGVFGMFADTVGSGWGAFIAQSVPTFTYALGWIGTAAMVEFLFRIWRELIAIRSVRDT